MSYLDNDHELYKVVKQKLPSQKKSLKTLQKNQKKALDVLNEYKEHYKNGEMYEIDFARIKKITSELIDDREKDIVNFKGHIADIEKFIEVYERAYKQYEK
tara:strand:- start:1924 stop:2226 length:303 start_codon:yes stop_codon:yes gene_type:complete